MTWMIVSLATPGCLALLLLRGGEICSAVDKWMYGEWMRSSWVDMEKVKRRKERF